MRYNIDLGFGGSGGPWLAWHPQASRDGARKPAVWTLRDTDGVVVITDAPSRGFVIDLEMMKTGWEQASGRQGVAPERRWNATPARYEPQPGPDWKRCFSLPIALGKDKRGTWEQASLAARIALDDLLKAIAADPVDHGEQVPVVRCTGTKVARTRAGTTLVPLLSIQRWVDRPDVLDRLDDGEDAWSDDANGHAVEAAPSSPPPADPADPGPADEAAYGGVDPWGDGEAAAIPSGEAVTPTERHKQLQERWRDKAASAAASVPPKPARMRQRAKPVGPRKLDDDVVPF